MNQEKSIQEIWNALNEVPDPEIPVISLVEMGIVRQVRLLADGVEVTITPTFSGCPALKVMEEEIAAKLRDIGCEQVTVKTTLSPPWTSDWITDAARDKLKAFGLAPPTKHGGDIQITFFEPVACPYCDSDNTTIKNSFGSTLCRAIHYCNNCQQPFEQFKPL
ncbi:MAG: phenylacetate-CoA oxygenase subunit PaaJ [Chloroflexi bacterium]|nr:MAG: phenylacetate-CoA oxygenase subunit PaaJ [Chloroflexota bacterium]